MSWQQNKDLMTQLSTLLDQMIKTNRGEQHRSHSSGNVRRLTQWLMLLTVLSILLVVVRVAFHRWLEQGTENATNISEWWAAPFMLCGLALVITLVFNEVAMLWRVKSDPFNKISKLINGSICDDAQYIAELEKFPKDLLEYALLHYRHHWGTVDGRTALLAGDVRKLGLFPSLLVIFVAAPKLLEMGSNIWLWMPIILAGCFLIMAFAVVFSGERRAQVIALLQYVIDHKETNMKVEGS